MKDSQNKNNVSKVYCDKCDSVFNSKQKFEEHYQKHQAGIYCESCPIDTVIQKFVNLFKRPHDSE